MHTHFETVHVLGVYSLINNVLRVYSYIRTGIRIQHTWTRRARECSCRAACVCQSLCSARVARLLRAASASPRAPAAATPAIATSSQTASARSTAALPLPPRLPVDATQRRRAETAWPASQRSTCARALSSNTASLCVLFLLLLLLQATSCECEYVKCDLYSCEYSAVRVASRLAPAVQPLESAAARARRPLVPRAPAEST